MASRYYLVLLVCAGVASLTLADDLKDFVPGYKVEVLFTPDDCDYKARPGDRIYQHYNSSFPNGTLLGSSYTRKSGKPFRFNLGVRQVIKGIDMGMKGMCKGERRRITIPPELGFGFRALPSIPAGSTLIYDVELADIEPSTFKIEIVHEPEDCPRRSAVGDFIRQDYNGTFPDGKIFDTSYQRRRTFDFTLGEGEVITGVDIGMLGMCEGEIRRLTLPPVLAYGSRGSGKLVPPHSTLIFDTKLVEIVSGKLRWHKLAGPKCANSEKAAKGDQVTLYYRGFTQDAFDSDSDSGVEDFFTETLGSSGVLRGLSMGVEGMCRGERRRLLIPPEQAVGQMFPANVPQNQRLAVEVILVDLLKSSSQ